MAPDRLAESSPSSASAFPMVAAVAGIPGRVMTPEKLQEMGLLAEAELPPAIVSRPRVSASRVTDKWPSWAIELSRAPLKDDGTPDRSTADINWCMIAHSWGHTVEDIAAKLPNVSQKAYERVFKMDDKKDPLLTARKAARYAEQNRQRG